MLDLYNCSQRLCYHDVPIRCKAPRRGGPHDWPKRVVVIHCMFSNFIQLCTFDGFSNRTEILSLGHVVMYQC